MKTQSLSAGPPAPASSPGGGAPFHLCLRAAAALLCLGGLPGAAVAHVRWFTSLPDTTLAPVAPTALIASRAFLALLLATLCVLALVQLAEGRLLRRGHLLARLADRTQPGMTGAAALLVRIGLALYLAGLALFFRDAPVTLAPELRASGDWIAPHQLLLAACFLFRRGVLAGCAGLLALAAYSIHLFGWVHMIDYHFLLGACVFLVLESTGCARWSRRGLAIFRVTVATSFMWVGIEKWLHPEWTQDVLEHQLPVLLLGQSPQFVATAAGFVEVALAFLVLFGRVSAQVAAATLLLLISSAIPLAGPIDAIGHLPMLFSLLVLAGTGNRVAAILEGLQASDALATACRFVIIVAGLTGLYFLAHWLVAGGADGPAWNQPQLRTALVWVGVLGVWLLHVLHACRRGGGLAPTPAAA